MRNYQSKSEIRRVNCQTGGSQEELRRELEHWERERRAELEQASNKLQHFKARVIFRIIAAIFLVCILVFRVGPVIGFLSPPAVALYMFIMLHIALIYVDIRSLTLSKGRTRNA
jgi:hypothetical protein